MQGDRKLCPVCRSSRLIMKYEAKYVYSYVIDEDKPGLKNDTIFLPFLYDKREQVEADQYIECGSCGTRLPVFYTQADGGFDLKIAKRSFTVQDGPSDLFSDTSDTSGDTSAVPDKK